MKHILTFGLATFYLSLIAQINGTCHTMPLGISEQAVKACRGFYSDSLSAIDRIIDETGEKALIWDDYRFNARWTVIFQGDRSIVIVITPYSERSRKAYSGLFNMLYTSIGEEFWGFEQLSGANGYIKYKFTNEKNLAVFIVSNIYDYGK